MKSRQNVVGVVIATIVAALGSVRGDDVKNGTTFGFLASGYTQELWGTTTSFAKSGGYLGGVVVMPNGDVIAAECMTSGTRLHRFQANVTHSQNGTILHDEIILPAGGGCGMVYHPDGTLYLNMNDGVNGVANVDPATGAVLRTFGPRGNALGIAVDPLTNHLVYVGRDCAATLFGPTCTLYDIDPASATPTATVLKIFNANVDVGYIDGLYFDPSGNFIFLDNRFPVERLTVIRRSGNLVQHVDLTGGSEPAGIGFHAARPKFIATNNTDGTMTRFDFPNDDYTQPPVVTSFASDGFRGDLMQAGPDRCLYLTQGGTRFDDNREGPSGSNSIVQICGGFATPRGVTPAPDAVPPTTTATLSPLPNAAGWNTSNVTVNLTAVDNVGGSGVSQITYSVAGAQTVATTSVAGSSAAAVISAEGVSTITFFATDNAGNVETAKTVMIRMDKTAPTITGARNPAPNAFGWNNTPVTVSFQCSDALSGLAAGSPPAPTTLSTSGAGQSVSGTCVDVAGNAASATVQGINIDTNAPTITISASVPSLWPPNGKQVADVIAGMMIDTLAGIDLNTAVFTVVDTEGVIQPHGPVTVTGNGNYSFTLMLESQRSGQDKDGRQFIITVVGTDKAGNPASASTVVTVPHDQGHEK